MKILYKSCHEILEYDEIRLLLNLGFDVFSIGAYSNHSRSTAYRPGIQYDPATIQYWEEIIKDDIDFNHLTKEFVDHFDVIIVMHDPTWIVNNWEAIKHKIVIWRTIGQSIGAIEQMLASCRSEGMKIVRYSPTERQIPDYLGEDALIRFYKDENEYNNWNGKKSQIITFANSIVARKEECNLSLIEEATRSFPRSIFGAKSEEVGSWGSGFISYEQLKQELRDNRAFFYTGTSPASYTLSFIEAWITGIPIVAIGFKNWKGIPYVYEIPHLIENGITGFVFDDLIELQSSISYLLNSAENAKKISIAARNKAISIFGMKQVSSDWQNFLSCF